MVLYFRYLSSTHPHYGGYSISYLTATSASTAHEHAGTLQIKRQGEKWRRPQIDRLVSTTAFQTLYTAHLPIHSRLRRHIDLRPRRHGIIRLPKARHSLLLRIKLDPRLPIKRIRPTTRHRLLIPREAEHGQWDRDRDIDAHLPGLDLLLEALGRRAAARKDRNAVAVFVAVDEVHGVFVGLYVDADEDGAEDLLFVAGHLWCYVGDDCWADLKEHVST